MSEDIKKFVGRGIKAATALDRARTAVGLDKRAFDALKEQRRSRLNAATDKQKFKFPILGLEPRTSRLRVCHSTN